MEDLTAQVTEDDITSYSLAHVVHTNDLASHTTCSARLARACVDALDFKPHHAEHAMSMLPCVREHISETEHVVLHWALLAAAHNVRSQFDTPWCAALAKRESLSTIDTSITTITDALAPEPAPEPIVRFICAETALSSRHSNSSDSDIHSQVDKPPHPHLQQPAQGRGFLSLVINTKHSRQVRLERPPAIAMLALICSFARTQCNIRSFRPPTLRIHAFRILARGARGSVRVDISGTPNDSGTGNLPTILTIRSRHGIAPCVDLVHDIGDVLEDFDLVLAGEM